MGCVFCIVLRFLFLFMFHRERLGKTLHGLNCRTPETPGGGGGRATGRLTARLGYGACTWQLNLLCGVPSGIPGQSVRRAASLGKSEKKNDTGRSINKTKTLKQCRKTEPTKTQK